MSRIALALALLASLGSAAAAQGISGSVGNLAVSSEAPINIVSDVLEIDEPQRLATFLGRVRATQDNMLLTTDRLLVRYQPAAGGEGAQLRTVDAHGSVVMKVDDQVASGDVAHYDLAKEELTLSGNVVLSQGDNAIHGEKLIVNLRTGQARMVAKGQVSAVFKPNRTQQ